MHFFAMVDLCNCSSLRWCTWYRNHRFSMNQDILYTWHSELTEIGNRSRAMVNAEFGKTLRGILWNGDAE